MKKAAESHLPPYRIRPRFETKTSLSMEDLMAKFRVALQTSDAPCKGQVNPGYATFYFPKEEQHYWSPQLNITYEENENGCLIRGLYGPRPAVWTMFVFFYGLIAFVIVVIAVIAYSNYSLGNSAAIIYWIPVLIFVFLSLYFVAFTGQKMGREEMLVLHGFFEEVVSVSDL